MSVFCLLASLGITSSSFPARRRCRRVVVKRDMVTIGRVTVAVVAVGQLCRSWRWCYARLARCGCSCYSGVLVLGR